MSQNVALVTGASSGIGLEVCRRLRSLGYRIIGIARHFDAESKRICDHAIEQDLSDIEQLPEFFASLAKQYPSTSLLVANAGRGLFGSVEELSARDIADLVNLNLTSQILLARAFVPLFKSNRRGDLIFLGSEATHQAGRKGTAYCASKFGLRGFAQALRQEVANRGIRVCLINPGLVDTPFYDLLNFRPGQQEGQFLTAEDVADTVEWVLKSSSGMVLDEINLTARNHVIEFKKGK